MGAVLSRLVAAPRHTPAVAPVRGIDPENRLLCHAPRSEYTADAWRVLAPRPVDPDALAATYSPTERLSFQAFRFLPERLPTEALSYRSEIPVSRACAARRASQGGVESTRRGRPGRSRSGPLLFRRGNDPSVPRTGRGRSAYRGQPTRSHRKSERLPRGGLTQPFSHTV